MEKPSMDALKLLISIIKIKSWNNKFKPTRGIPQRTILGPLLFTTCLNEAETTL